MEVIERKGRGGGGSSTEIYTRASAKERVFTKPRISTHCREVEKRKTSEILRKNRRQNEFNIQ